MLDFQDILGQDPVRQYLASAAESDRVSHAYLLSGEQGLGKRALAKAFARRLLCENRGQAPCGRCHACIQVEADTHPDLVWIRHEKPGTIGVEEVRRGLCEEAMIRPYSGRRRIFILPDAELMTPQAQNAALKTIEEPPDYAVILLLTGREEALLETILSRTVKLRLRPVPEGVIISWLREKKQIPATEAAMAAAFSGGNPGRALDMAESEEFRQRIGTCVSVLKRLPGSGPETVGALAEELLKTDPGLKEFPDIARMYFRDLLMIRRGETEQLYFSGDRSAMRTAAASVSPGQAGHILEMLEQTEDRLRANGNPELLTELLLREIRAV